MPRRLALALLIAVAVAAGTATTTGAGEGPTAAAAAPPAAAQAPPLLPHTRSYYMGNASPDAATRLGCANADTQGRLTLFFGAPIVTQGAFGATLWGGADRTAAQAADLVRDFVRGYAWCRRSPTQQVLVGMGTSNSTIDRRNDLWVYGHGVAWATAVRDAAAWAEAHYPGVARIYGAWDAEPSWSAPQKAEQWLRGYDSVPGRRALHANFSADGCPRDTAHNGGCNNGWNQETLWRLAWRYEPSLPIPQIYATSGVNAAQWQKIDEYGARAHGDGMTFFGAMAQHGACAQVGGCRLIDNPPQVARDQLLFVLNSHPLTQQPTLENATDMHWH
ncbi:MAG TPA: hypothetical protein VIL36_14285, partial [Acidimicrobiales bacterium]